MVTASTKLYFLQECISCYCSERHLRNSDLHQIVTLYERSGVGPRECIHKDSKFWLKVFSLIFLVTYS